MDLESLSDRIILACRKIQSLPNYSDTKEEHDLLQSMQNEISNIIIPYTVITRSNDKFPIFIMLSCIQNIIYNNINKIQMVSSDVVFRYVEMFSYLMEKNYNDISTFNLVVDCYSLFIIVFGQRETKLVSDIMALLSKLVEIPSNPESLTHSALSICYSLLSTANHPKNQKFSDFLHNHNVIAEIFYMVLQIKFPENPYILKIYAQTCHSLFSWDFFNKEIILNNTKDSTSDFLPPHEKYIVLVTNSNFIVNSCNFIINVSNDYDTREIFLETLGKLVSVLKYSHKWNLDNFKMVLFRSIEYLLVTDDKLISLHIGQMMYSFTFLSCFLKDFIIHSNFYCKALMIISNKIHDNLKEIFHYLCNTELEKEQEFTLLKDALNFYISFAVKLSISLQLEDVLFSPEALQIMQNFCTDVGRTVLLYVFNIFPIVKKNQLYQSRQLDMDLVFESLYLVSLTPIDIGMLLSSMFKVSTELVNKIVAIFQHQLSVLYKNNLDYIQWALFLNLVSEVFLTYLESGISDDKNLLTLFGTESSRLQNLVDIDSLIMIENRELKQEDIIFPCNDRLSFIFMLKSCFFVGNEFLTHILSLNNFEDDLYIALYALISFYGFILRILNFSHCRKEVDVLNKFCNLFNATLIFKEEYRKMCLAIFKLFNLRLEIDYDHLLELVMIICQIEESLDFSGSYKAETFLSNIVTNQVRVSPKKLNNILHFIDNRSNCKIELFEASLNLLNGLKFEPMPIIRIVETAFVYIEALYASIDHSQHGLLFEKTLKSVIYFVNHTITKNDLYKLEIIFKFYKFFTFYFYKMFNFYKKDRNYNQQMKNIFLHNLLDLNSILYFRVKKNILNEKELGQNIFYDIFNCIIDCTERFAKMFEVTFLLPVINKFIIFSSNLIDMENQAQGSALDIMSKVLEGIQVQMLTLNHLGHCFKFGTTVVLSEYGFLLNFVIKGLYSSDANICNESAVCLYNIISRYKFEQVEKLINIKQIINLIINEKLEMKWSLIVRKSLLRLVGIILLRSCDDYKLEFVRLLSNLHKSSNSCIIEFKEILLERNINIIKQRKFEELLDKLL